MKYSFVGRSRVILFLVLVFGVVLVTKLFFVQVVHGSTYSLAADHQYATPSSDIYERGSIYFRTKSGQLVSAATQTSGYKIAINPAKIKDKEDVFKKLSNIAIIDHD